MMRTYVLNDSQICAQKNCTHEVWLFTREIRRRSLKVAVVGIPKTIDNDIRVIDKSIAFDTAVEEAQRAINSARVEAESAENGIGVVKFTETERKHSI
ncbi:ATP-dependent 6-phosphofructokinase [Trifolium repens]|nr:ATP-dependent 6-phosphofructokinase [Trifolium repens]